MVLHVGDVLPEVEAPKMDRLRLAYMAVSMRDPNLVHMEDDYAARSGLPGVIAHGMYTMALAARAVATWTHDAPVLQIGCKFTAPVVVPDDDSGVVVVVGGSVKSVEDGRATIALEVTCAGQKVLGMPRAVVALDG